MAGRDQRVITVDLVLRIVNVGVGVLACLAVLAVVLEKKPDRAEALGMVAGACLCVAVAGGSLGFLLGWDAALWLPFITCSLVYIALGRLVQLVGLRRKQKGPQ